MSADKSSAGAAQTAWMHELADMATTIRTRNAAARGLPAPAPVVVRSGPQLPRPVQPLPAGFDIDKARAELAALEAAGPGVSEFGYVGESAREMAEWRDNLHRHQIAGMRMQIAQWEAQREAA